VVAIVSTVIVGRGVEHFEGIGRSGRKETDMLAEEMINCQNLKNEADEKGKRKRS
jgi:hypothetical protein